MKRTCLALVAAAVLPVLAGAAEPKAYQVTGPVLEVTADHITVEKNKERWEIARTADTKVTGDLKPGAKVTIQYRMTAASVEVKPTAGKEAKPAKAK